MAIKQKEAMERLIPTIAKAADIFVDLSQKYPDLSAAVVGATPPIVALGVAAGVSALTMGGGNGGRFAALATKWGGRGVGALGVAGAGAAGYAVGDMLVRPGVDKLTQLGTGNQNATLGTAIYEYFNKPSAQKAPEAKAELVVDVAPGFVVKRKSVSNNGMDMSMTTRQSNTGNIFNGAP